jgi:hypothetical protein
MSKVMVDIPNMWIKSTNNSQNYFKWSLDIWKYDQFNLQQRNAY